MANARAKRNAGAKAPARRVRQAKPEKTAKPEIAVKPQKVEKPSRADRQENSISAQPEPFRLVSIERTEPPNGASGKNWFRYNIRQGSNAINGYLQGTATGVKHTAEQIVGQLNERRAGRWGYRTTRAAAPAQGA